MILKLLMDIINHMILNHFRDGGGGGVVGEEIKKGNGIEEGENEPKKTSRK